MLGWILQKSNHGEAEIEAGLVEQQKKNRIAGAIFSTTKGHEVFFLLFIHLLFAPASLKSRIVFTLTRQQIDQTLDSLV